MKHTDERRSEGACPSGGQARAADSPAAGAGAVRLRASATWALAGNAGYAACQWGILAVMAKLATAADVGQFALALALVAPAMSLANLNLRALQATDARTEFTFGTYVGLRLVTTALALAATAATALALGYRGTALTLVLLVLLAKAFEAVSDVTFGLQQHRERFRRVALSLLLRGAASVAIVGVVLRATGDVRAAVLAMALTWGVVLAASDLPASARLASPWPVLAPPALVRLARLALPVGCLMGLASLTINVPRYAIDAHLGATALGHFAALAYLVVAVNQPVLALGAAASPRLARAFVSDRTAYRRLVARTLRAATALGGLLVVATAGGGEAFLRLAYAPEYAAHHAVLVWLALAGALGFVASALGYAVTAARRFHEQLAVAAAALAACIVVSQVAVPRLGLVGAAWAVLASEAVRTLGLALVYAGLGTTRAAAATPVSPLGRETPTAAWSGGNA